MFFYTTIYFIALFNLNALFKLNPINAVSISTFFKETLVKNP